MRNLPDTLPPTPADFVILGWGREFETHGDGFRGAIWSASEPRWETRNLRGSSINAVYAAPSDSNIARNNAGIISQLNRPRPPFPPITPLPPEAPPLPPGYLPIGLGGEFSRSAASEFVGLYWNPQLTEWLPSRGASAGNDVRRFYATTTDSVFARDVAPPAFAPVDAALLRPLPPPRRTAMLNIPEGHVLLGWSDQLNLRHGQGMRTWGTLESWLPFNSPFPRLGDLIAAPIDGPLHRDNADAALFYGSQPTRTTPRPPEGFVVLGPGNFNFQETAMLLTDSDAWSRPTTFLGPDSINIFAFPMDSEIAIRYPERVRRYNPMPPCPPLPFVPPPLPDARNNWVILGIAGDIKHPTPRARCSGLYVRTHDSFWNYSESLETTNGFEIQAFPPDSPLVALNLAAARAYNPTFMAYAPFEPTAGQFATLPPDHILIGWGNELIHPGDGGTFGDDTSWTTDTSTRWIQSPGSNHRTGFYAGRIDCPLALANPASIAYHRDRLSGHQSPATPTPVAELPALFRLSFHGVPVASREEFAAAINPLLSTPAHSQLANLIWESLAYADPEARVAEWAEREPVILAGIDFHPAPRVSDPIDVLAIAADTRSIGEIITRAAAGVLLRGGLSDHFQYLETGELAIVPDNPPSLDQGYEIVRRTMEIRETGQKLDNYSAWTLGMLGDQLERLFGDSFDPSEVMQATGKALSTYTNAVGTFRALWANRRNLSFTHHKEAYYSKITHDQMNWVLDTADSLRLSVSDQRKLTTHVRVYGTEGLAADMPDSPEALLERIEVRSVNKNYLFFLPATNLWYEYRGPFELIPNGASPIFNADTRARLTVTGQPERLQTWTPAGIVVPVPRGHSATLARNRAEALPLDAEVTRPTGGNRRGVPVEDMAIPDLREAETPSPRPALMRG